MKTNFFILLFLSALFTHIPCFGQWNTNPSVNTLISTSSYDQYLPKIISDEAGGVILVWEKNSDIYAQRIDASGVAQWTSGGLVVCSATNAQNTPDIVSDGYGGAIISWLDYRNANNYDVYAQRIDHSGLVMWTNNGVPLCADFYVQDAPVIASDGLHGAIVVWEDDRNTLSNRDLYAQRIDSSGIVKWTVNGIAICTEPGDQTYASVLSNGTGATIITWQDSRLNNFHIYVQSVNASGFLQWTATGVPVCTATNVQYYPVLATDGNGGAIIAWNENRASAIGYDIYAQRVNSSGITQWLTNGVPVCTAPYDQAQTAIADDKNGGAYITWNDKRGGTQQDIYAQRVNGAGAPQWTLNGIPVCVATGDQNWQKIKSDVSGDATIVWQDNRTATYDIYSQRISSNGTVQWPVNGVAVCNATDQQIAPTLGIDDHNGVIVAWEDQRNGNNFNIYSQRINPNGLLCTDPVINFGSVISQCGGTVLLDAGNPGSMYSWSNSATTQTILVSASATPSVLVTNTDGCFSSATVSVTIIPAFNVSGTNTICIGSTTTLTAVGATTYTWSNGASTPDIIITQTISSSYTVSGTGTCGAYSKTIAVTVDPNCQDVWPGDANSDGIADNLDVLELGLHFTQTGPARASVINAWQSYFANNWAGTITNGSNVNHSDCNGDGTIDNNDTLAIYNNYGLTHAFKSTEQTVLNPQLSIVPDQTMVAKGTWGTSSVYLGDASTPISNINGVAFTVNFDQSLIEPNSFYIEYPMSFINATNQNLKFNKPDFSNGIIYTATTHTINGNVTDKGKIAVLHYKIKSTLTADAVLNISLVQAKKSDATGILTPLTTGTATVAAIGASVGLDELQNGNTFSIYPNPANQFVIIQSTNALQKVELVSVTGQVIISEPVTSNQHKIDLSYVANGVYFVTAADNMSILYRKKIVVNH